MAKSKKPTGLAIARDGYNFTCTWKIGDKDYGDGQAFQWRVNTGSKKGTWHFESVGTTTTKKAIKNVAFTTPTASTTQEFEFRVRGNRKAYTTGSGKKRKTINPDISSWESAVFKITAPDAPTLSASWDAATASTTTFTWEGKTDAHKWLVNCEYQSILVTGNETDGSKLTWKSTTAGWQTGTVSASSSRAITETTQAGSFTRWFRIRAKGPGGPSKWVYAKHVYGIPYTPVIYSAKLGGSNLCTVTWDVQQTAGRPISSVEVQYAFATPLANGECPSDPGWSTGATVKDINGRASATFSVGHAPGIDQALFVQVVAKWDDHTVPSDAQLVEWGELAEPENLSVSTNISTHRATVTVTNNSSVPDSFLVIRFMTKDNPGGFDIGIMPHGSSSTSIQCPAWDADDPIRFAVYAVQGRATSKSRADGVAIYNVIANAISEMVQYGGAVPAAPSGVTLTATDIPGTIQVSFDWTWTEATFAELSWADHIDAWESTDEPETYLIRNTSAPRWNISGLETGQTWYVRVRFGNGSDNDQVYGAYSEIKSIDLSSAPAIPVLALSDAVITEGGMVTASWSYVSTDGTLQASAELKDADTGDIIARTQTAQHVDLSADDLGWTAGETHSLAVRVVSQSGRMSDDWSDPVSVTVAAPLSAVISADSLQTQTITVDDVARSVSVLTVMPLTITVTGAGAGGTTSVAIERAETYHVTRPDESDLYGYEGETVALFTQTGEAQITIRQADLIGRLDDGAAYRIVATVSDGLGQSAEITKDFEVHWAHQALIPSATVTIDDEHKVAILTPVAPTGTAGGDVCDIYRLSADKPVLIYPGAQFGTAYVDPFPTIGEYGGHRFVFRTANGDYITADEELAWVDTGEDDGDILETPYNLIDFGTGRVQLMYEIDVSNSWSKDFEETHYLGGSVQGDWNPAVSRSVSVAAVAVAASDQDTIEAMRRLAEWTGICHVRTKEGSSYAADVQVSESYKQSNDQKLVSFSLKITRVDPEGYDGMTRTEWEQAQQEE